MPGLRRKDLKILLKSLEEQGVRITRKDKGWMLLFSNGGTEMVHETDSDWRGVLNMRAAIKRAGYTWPFDGRKEKKPVAAGAWVNAPISERSLQLAKAAIRKLKREGHTSVTAGGLAKASGLSHPTAQKALVALNYPKLEGKYSGWSLLTPAEQKAADELAASDDASIEAVMEKHGIKPDLELAVELKQIADENPAIKDAVDAYRADPDNVVVEEPEYPEITKAQENRPKPAPPRIPGPVGPPLLTPPVQKQEEPVEREFIDTHDSWTIDLDYQAMLVPGHLGRLESLTIGQMRSMVGALGLELEVRVWKKGD